MNAPVPGRGFDVTLRGVDVINVPSFGVKHSTACGNGCCHPTISIALGVAGEVEHPLMMTLGMEQADQFIAWLQREQQLARGEKVN
jgi:hypothetical protein